MSQKTANRADRPVLIFGAPRSGTSLLSRLLDSHSRIAIPFESHLFNQWYPRLSSYGDIEDPKNLSALVHDIIDYGVVHDWSPRPEPDAVLALVTEKSFAGVGRAVLQWWANEKGAPRWGEKTPHHALHYDAVIKAWPDALAVIIRRDPRSVALSWKRARFGGNHVIAFAKAWNNYAIACAEIRKTIPKGDWIDLSYEDLVSDPQEQLKSIMNFLGETYEDQQLAFHQTEDSWNTDKRNAEKLRQPISAESVDLWRKGLSKKEISLIESLCRDQMLANGYALSDDISTATPLNIKFENRISYPIQRVVGLTKNLRGFVYLGRDIMWHIAMLKRKLWKT